VPLTLLLHPLRSHRAQLFHGKYKHTTGCFRNHTLHDAATDIIQYTVRIGHPSLCKYGYVLK